VTYLHDYNATLPVVNPTKNLNGKKIFKNYAKVIFTMIVLKDKGVNGNNYI